MMTYVETQIMGECDTLVKEPDGTVYLPFNGGIHTSGLATKKNAAIFFCCSVLHYKYLLLCVMVFRLYFDWLAFIYFYSVIQIKDNCQ